MLKAEISQDSKWGHPLIFWMLSPQLHKPMRCFQPHWKITVGSQNCSIIIIYDGISFSDLFCKFLYRPKQNQMWLYPTWRPSPSAKQEWAKRESWEFHTTHVVIEKKKACWHCKICVMCCILTGALVHGSSSAGGNPPSLMGVFWVFVATSNFRTPFTICHPLWSSQQDFPKMPA